MRRRDFHRGALAAALAGPAMAQAKARPNILVVMADDLGFSDIGPFGSEIATPNLDALAREGRLMTSMYATVMPHTSHAEFLFGVDHHLTVDRYSAVGRTAAPPPGPNDPQGLSVAEVLRDAGYHTYMAGTWDSGATAASDPKARGFERFHVVPSMAGDYYPPDGKNVPLPRENFRYVSEAGDAPAPEGYITDVWTDKLIADLAADRADGKPFFVYAAYTTPHFPLQAPDALIARQRGKYAAGYDAVRKARLAKQASAKLFPRAFAPAEPVSEALGYKRWDQLTADERAYEARRMEVYAAMVENLDANFGRLTAALKAQGRYDNTLIVFTSTNGAAQAVVTHRDPAGIDNGLANLGRKNSWVAYTERWAEVSNAPFARWKAKATEGGVVVPTIVRLPGQSAGRPPTDAVAMFRDLTATVVAVAGVARPAARYRGRPVLAYSGRPLVALLRGGVAKAYADDEVLIEEHRLEAFVRQGRWKAVLITDAAINPYDGADPANADLIAAIKAGETAKARALLAKYPSSWRLYDLSVDRGETRDLAASQPAVLKGLQARFEAYRKAQGIVDPI